MKTVCNIMLIPIAYVDDLMSSVCVLINMTFEFSVLNNSDRSGTSDKLITELQLFAFVIIRYLLRHRNSSKGRELSMALISKIEILSVPESFILYLPDLTNLRITYHKNLNHTLFLCYL